MKITLTNDFHCTSITLITRGGQLSARQVARARRALCGIRGCTCGDDVGAKPESGWYVNPSTGVARNFGA